MDVTGSSAQETNTMNMLGTSTAQCGCREGEEVIYSGLKGRGGWSSQPQLAVISHSEQAQ